MVGYLKFDSIAEAEKHFRRCRKIQHFILTPQGVIKDDPTCAHCKVKLTADPPKHQDMTPGYRGNRAMYHPGKRKTVVLHYVCSWESLLDRVFA